MKIGEIKAQAILLMYPDTVVKLDEDNEEDVERALFELKSDPNLEGLLFSCVGSINRALCYIEANGLSQTKCVDVPCQSCESKDEERVAFKSCPDLLCVDRLLHIIEGSVESLDYEKQGDYIITERRRGSYTLVYKTKIPKITRITRENYELSLPYGMAECIPYFVASELFMHENEALAKEYRRYFEEQVKAIGGRDAPCQECLLSVYSIE